MARGPLYSGFPAQTCESSDHRRQPEFVPWRDIIYLLSLLFAGYSSSPVQDLRLNTIVMVAMTGTGSPLRIVGEYFHCFTARTASSSNNGCPLRMRISATSPSSSTVT